MEGRSFRFPAILAAPTVLSPGSTSNFYMLVLGHDTRVNSRHSPARLESGHRKNCDHP